MKFIQHAVSFCKPFKVKTSMWIKEEVENVKRDLTELKQEDFLLSYWAT